MAQPNAPFTNHLAEQAVRMPQVEQKVSGCLRAPQSATDYRVIRYYCVTMQKQEENIFESFVFAFKCSTH